MGASILLYHVTFSSQCDNRPREALLVWHAADAFGCDFYAPHSLVLSTACFYRSPWLPVFHHAKETSDMSQPRHKAGLQLLSSKINEHFRIETTAEQLQGQGWLAWQRPGNRNNYFQNEKLCLGPFINSPSVIRAIEKAAQLGQQQDVVAMLGDPAVGAVQISCCHSVRCCSVTSHAW
jgi:hypothetical protein